MPANLTSLLLFSYPFVVGVGERTFHDTKFTKAYRITKMCAFNRATVILI